MFLIDQRGLFCFSWMLNKPEEDSQAGVTSAPLKSIPPACTAAHKRHTTRVSLTALAVDLIVRVEEQREARLSSDVTASNAAKLAGLVPTDILRAILGLRRFFTRLRCP